MIVQSQTPNNWSHKPSDPPFHPAHPIQPLGSIREYCTLDVSWKAVHFGSHQRLDGLRCLSLSLCRLGGGLIYSLGFISTRFAVLICSLSLCTVTGCDRLIELELSGWDSVLSAILKCLNVIRKRYCRTVDLDVWHACQNGWAWQNSGCGTQRWWLLVEASILYVYYILYVSCILKEIDLSQFSMPLANPGAFSA